MKQVCRMDKTNKRPYCLRKPCSYRLDGTCSGPVVAVKDYYSLQSRMEYDAWKNARDFPGEVGPPNL